MRNKEKKRVYDINYYNQNKIKKAEKYKIYYQTVRTKKLAANKKWMEENKEYRKEYSRKRQYEASYGLSIEEYDTKRDAQKGCCAICGTHESLLVKRLYIDHNHDTKEVRGLLCVNCNMLIGHARENIDILKIAIVYLKTWNTQKKK